MDLNNVKSLIGSRNVQFIDFKVVDLWGKWRHVTMPASDFTEATMYEGIGFDASNFGCKATESSDLVLIPDLDRAFIYPNADTPTLSLVGDVFKLYFDV